MTLANFNYVTAKTLEEASELFAKMGDQCQIMAGGTDILPLLKDHVISPEAVIDIKQIPDLKFIEFVPGVGLKIGALATLDEIWSSDVVREQNQAVADAAHFVASKQIRCKGTMAGNICNASPSADTASILLAMDAKVKTTKREIPIGAFFVGVKKTSLEPGEIVTEIIIPELKAGEGAAYLKHAIRKAMDLAIIGVAVKVTMDGLKIKDCRIAFGGAGITPLRAPEAENMLIGSTFTEELLEEAAAATAKSAKPISDVRASAEYRSDMIRVFTTRAFKKALESVKV